MDFDHCLYKSVEKLVYKTVHRFRRHYGGVDLQDDLQNGNLFFAQALRSFDPDKGVKFSTWVCYKVWKGLLEIKRTEAKHAEALPRVPLEGDYPVEGPGFLEGMLSGLSEDARRMLGVALKNRQVRDAFPPEHKKSTLFKILRRAGWAWQKITDTFFEIAEVMT